MSFEAEPRFEYYRAQIKMRDQRICELQSTLCEAVALLAELLQADDSTYPRVQGRVQRWMAEQRKPRTEETA